MCPDAGLLVDMLIRVYISTLMIASIFSVKNEKWLEKRFEDLRAKVKV